MVIRAYHERRIVRFSHQEVLLKLNLYGLLKAENFFTPPSKYKQIKNTKIKQSRIFVGIFTLLLLLF